jgi:hypothetical protein
MIAEMGMGLVLAMPPKSKPTPPSACRDKAARMLWRAGFRGDKNAQRGRSLGGSHGIRILSPATRNTTAAT